MKRCFPYIKSFTNSKSIYDGNGNIIKAANPDDGIMMFAYDLLDRLTSYAYPEGYTISMEYDANGNEIKTTDGYVTTYGFEARNLVEQINYTGGKEAQFVYNKNGELVAMMDRNGTVNFTLDLLGQITSVNDQNEKWPAILTIPWLIRPQSSIRITQPQPSYIPDISALL